VCRIRARSWENVRFIGVILHHTLPEGGRTTVLGGLPECQKCLLWLHGGGGLLLEHAPKGLLPYIFLQQPGNVPVDVCADAAAVFLFRDLCVPVPQSD
jgi:hypothetical protein